MKGTQKYERVIWKKGVGAGKKDHYAFLEQDKNEPAIANWWEDKSTIMLR